MSGNPNDFVKEQLKREIKIIGTSQVENYTVYTVQIIVTDCHWTVKHRYSEFCELQEQLITMKRSPKAKLPPKKVFGNTSKAFIEKRRSDLEAYLQTVVDENPDLPKPLMIFLEFDIYDLFGVAQALAAELYDKGDTILSANDMCEMTPMQLYAITERLKLPLPTCGSEDARYDIGHVMDFVATLRYLRIAGSPHNLGTSNRKVVQLPFDLSNFKVIEKLQIDLCNMKIISGLGDLKSTLRSLSVHKSASSMKEILLSDVDTSNEMNGEGLKTVIQMVLPWDAVTKADFRYNNLQNIDASIRLIPRVEHLTFSYNQLTDVNNLEHLSSLTYLDLSHNAFEVLENMNVKLGNLRTLNLSYNHLQSLQGLSKLYSLVNLDVGHNNIEKVEEVHYVSNLPCLEKLVLFANPITGIVDYRTKILKLFGERVAELNLDGQPASSQEMDTVAILSAIQKSKLQQTKRKQHSHTVEISGSPSSSKSHSSTPSKEGRSPKPEATDFQAQIEKIRQEGGKNWLQKLNEVQAAERKYKQELARSKVTTAKKTTESDSKRKTAPVTLLSLLPQYRSTPGDDQASSAARSSVSDTARSSASDTARSSVSDAADEQVRHETQISPRALAHCLFDELARHKAHGIHVVGDLFTNLSIFFKGPVLCTYGTRHRLSDQPHPEITGSTVVEILKAMDKSQRKEFIGILKGLSDGSAKLYNPIHPSQHEATQVYEYVIKLMSKDFVFDLSSQVEVKKVVPPKEKDQPMADDVKKDEKVQPITKAKKTDADKSVQTLPTNQSKPVPEYQKAELEYLSKCIASKVIATPAAMDFLRTMTPSELVKYFHENVAQISLEPEKLVHLLWTTVITFAAPKTEVVALVMLSGRAIYFVSSTEMKFFPGSTTPKTHRRIRSDFGGANGKALTFKSGQVAQTNQSGVLHTTDTSELDCVQCQHRIDLCNVKEVFVGLFAQKLRITGPSSDTTVTLLTQNFQLTKEFQEQLMKALPDGDKRPPHSPEPEGGDIYSQNPILEQQTGSSEYVHPSNVTFYYQNEETIDDLRHVLSESLFGSSEDLTESSMLFYRICYKTFVGELKQAAEQLVTEPGEGELCSLFVINQHIALCNEDHVSYPLPTFIRSLPESVHYHLVDARAIRSLKRVVLSDFTSKDITLIFEVLDLDVDISKDHFSSSDEGAAEQGTPDVAWTVLLPSQEDRERVVKMLSTQWKEIHDGQLSIQVSA